MKRVDFKSAKSLISKNDVVAMIVVIKHDSEEWNIIPVQWFTQTSIKPPMFAISIGHSRYSYLCLQEADEFNICIPKKELKNELLACATSSGKDVNKFVEFDIDYFYGRFKRVPIIKNSFVAFECKYVSQIKTGDHTIFIGESKYSWLAKETEDSYNYLSMKDL